MIFLFAHFLPPKKTPAGIVEWHESNDHKLSNTTLTPPSTWRADPKVLIIDETGQPLQDKYYEVDSTMQLSCIVRHVAMKSSAVLWSHGDQVLNYDTNRGGVRWVFFGPHARPRLTDDWTAHARTHTQRRESLNTATAGVIVRRVCVCACVRLCECSGPRRLNLCFAICAERRCERAKPPAHSHSRARGGALGGVRGRCDSEMMKRIRPTAGKMNPARITL